MGYIDVTTWKRPWLKVAHLLISDQNAARWLQLFKRRKHLKRLKRFKQRQSRRGGVLQALRLRLKRFKQRHGRRGGALQALPLRLKCLRQ
jgi:hypothetical protein